MRVLDLFSGIGGFSLGLERAGMTTVAFCEVDPFCRAVLAQHWPGVPIYDDVRTLTADALRRDGIAVDVICGGFPCQDVSFAGKRAGLEGARSGLWSEYARLIGELRPKFVVVENVPGLLSLGMGAVLGDLAALGYDAVWDCVPASAVGAPHRRDRVWIVAHATDQNEHDGAEHAEMGRAPPVVADTHKLTRHQGRAGDAAEVARGRDTDRGGKSCTSRLAEHCESGSCCFNPNACDGNDCWLKRQGFDWPDDIRDANVSGLALREGQSRDAGEEREAPVGADRWLTEPDVGRVADGVPARVDRLRALGNAVVPQISEMIGRAIMAAG